VDPWGLKATEPELTYFTQGQWTETFGQTFANNSCAATSLLNELSEEYTTQTNQAMTQAQGTAAMQAAVDSGNTSKDDASINDWQAAANDMWGTTGQAGTWTYNEQGEHQIYAIDNNQDGFPDHFVNSSSPEEYYDPWSGNTGNVSDLETQMGRPTRGLDFNN
jgi:hypothetical protein